MTVTRFAPSPTGALHLGHAYAALFAAKAAKDANGRFLVRIEDIDRARCRPEHDAAILADLDWLGLVPDGPVVRQSERFGAYDEALARLQAQDLVYPCFCTRKDVAAAARAPHGAVALYPGICRGLDTTTRRRRLEVGAAHALRLDSARAAALAGPLLWHDRGRGSQLADPALLGDIVLARKDAPVSYHLAVTVDDAAQGVTLVTRGADLHDATHVQRLLMALLGLAVPTWHHHALILDPDGRRFAKRDRALTLAALRARGVSAAEVRAAVWEWAEADAAARARLWARLSCASS